MRPSKQPSLKGLLPRCHAKAGCTRRVVGEVVLICCTASRPVFERWNEERFSRLQKLESESGELASGTMPAIINLK